jgi:hypothetical protein
MFLLKLLTLNILGATIDEEKTFERYSNMNIINIVNFIRSEEEYRTSKEELIETLENQVALVQKYNHPATFLFQHDAFTKPEWVKRVPRTENIEIGVWLELNRSLIERAGCEWKGLPERTWQYFSHIDLTCGYTPEERKRIIDIVMSDFKDVFGSYPKTVGSWIIDAVSLGYMREKYGVSASLNCKDQWLTDGYSLWGGYYNQAYYPCKNNMFCPAQTKDEQIDLPVFRMLGSDPVRQYDCALSEDNGQNVITLECYLHPKMDPRFGGSNEEWTRWFLDQMQKYDPLSFSYAQAGQENPFRWSGQKKGFTMQMRLFDELAREGKIKLMTVSDTADMYRSRYPMTPASVTEAETPENQHGVWYCCKNYRTYVYGDNDYARIKDLTLFDEDYKERYLTDNCKDSKAFYDNLHLVDSYRWGRENGRPSGIKFIKDGQEFEGKITVKTERNSDSSITVTLTSKTGVATVELTESGITVRGCSIGWIFANNTMSQIALNDSYVTLVYNGFKREIPIHGTVDKDAGLIHPKDGYITLKLEKQHV